MQDPSGELTITGVVQREAWLQRAMPPAEQLGQDLWSLPVPIPDNPLRYVSVYAFGTGEGLVLIDAGWGAEESWRALRDGLESIGAGVADVRGVLVTHMHFDHVGLAGRVRQASGAWIAMHPADQAVFARSDYRSAERAVAVEAEFLRGLGASPAEAAAAVGTAEQWEKFTTIALPDRLLTDGELADVPGWKLRAVHTPGHTPGHLCFVDERSRRLFSGDHVLPRITPNISVQRGAPPDPLGDYLDSLARTRDLDVDEVLPAHEWRFRGLPGRVDAITAHHERRLAELLDAIRRGPGSTPWQLAGELTWSRPWDQYSGQMRIFAVTETAAHAHLLERRGLVTASRTRRPAYTARTA
jgi:glyoxylase-like metal-dependent hydrolase (beta-lactamase superfamily II)